MSHLFDSHFCVALREDDAMTKMEPPYIMEGETESEDEPSQYDGTVTEYDENIVEEYLTDDVETADEEIQVTEDDDPFNECETTDVVEELYNCNACGIEFTSVQQHIDDYHSEQDVILDVGEKQKDDDIFTIVFKQEPADENKEANNMEEFSYNEEFSMGDDDQEQGSYMIAVDDEQETNVSI